MTTESSQLVSIVVPVLDEADNISAMMRRFDEILAANRDYRFEFVVVDDGSTDQTLELLRKHAESRSDLAVVVLSRNFGSHAAISAGLAEAAGDCAIVIGGDLQEPPELVGTLLQEWEIGYDVVWGVREQRVGQRFFGRFLSGTFTKLLTRLSDLDNYPAEGPSGVLCSRQVIDVVLRLPERNRNVLGLMAWSGFRQGRVQYRQQERAAGETKWSRPKKLKLAVDSFVQFSFLPVRLMTYSGLAIAALGFIYAIFLIVRRVFAETGVEGWTTVVVLVLIVGGVQLVMLGVLGEYLWRAVDEARGRPLYVVRETVRPLPGAIPSGQAALQREGDDDHPA